MSGLSESFGLKTDARIFTVWALHPSRGDRGPQRAIRLRSRSICSSAYLRYGNDSAGPHSDDSRRGTHAAKALAR